MVEPTGVKRKLAVILAADVEGYSRLMGADEEATLKTLSAYRDIIDGLIARHLRVVLCRACLVCGRMPSQARQYFR